MENVERTQFVVLTGHLDEQPLPDLIRSLRVQRKTGRLRVEYADGPGSFFFEDGQMVDAHLGQLRGLEALHAALALGGAAFNFNPLVKPPERNIDRQEQRFIQDLIETPRREGLAEIKIARGEFAAQAAHSLAPSGQRQLAPAPTELIAPIEERLAAVEEAIITTSRRFSRERLVYAVAIGFLVGLSLMTTIGVIYDPFGISSAPVPAAAAPAASSGAAMPASQPEGGGASGVERAGSSPVPSAKAESENANGEAPPVPSSAAVIGTRRASGASAPQGEYVVQILVEVKDGRVTDARVWNPRPGAGAYEAVALKMARERRYPESFSGSERLRIRVRP